jgi:hypothetical protein
VREVPTDDAALNSELTHDMKAIEDALHHFFALFGDAFHGEPLAGVILYAAEENQRDLVSTLGNRIQDIFFAKDKLTLPRSYLDESVI